MTKKNYLATAAVLSGTATVTAVGNDERGAWVELDQTWFHPQGGGQKADRGTLGDLRVVHVAHAEAGSVRHYVEGEAPLPVGAGVDLSVEASWREQNARWHSGGHLIAALAEENFPGVKAESGHHWPGEGRVEFAVTSSPDLEAMKVRLNEAVDEAVSAELPVVVVGDPFSSRKVQIGTYPPVPCGGTHVPHTGMLAGMRVTGVKLKSGKLRVSYDV